MQRYLLRVGGVGYYPREQFVHLIPGACVVGDKNII